MARATTVGSVSAQASSGSPAIAARARPIHNSTPRVSTARAITAGGQRRVGDERQAAEGERVQLQMGPAAFLFGRRSQRPVLFRLARQRPQRLADLVGGNSAQYRDGAEVVPMQLFGEPAQHRLRCVGSYALDDELAPGDAEGDLRPIDVELRRTRGDAGGGRLERRVPARIHAEFVQRDREFDEELAELS